MFLVLLNLVDSAYTWQFICIYGGNLNRAVPGGPGVKERHYEGNSENDD